ncbi:MAG TPA: right-handed parallel beta-helix repeat-containing protein, partial [Ignavibacteriaceae bacterium]|nr:right-handed parallel beta-helix repeat-containing protein [Ignavibacteriaceae bacterium]
MLSLFIEHLTFNITYATVRFVSKSGSSTPPYTSWETAADSIQKCINLCVNGDTIYVANGVYKEQVVMIPGLSLIGAGLDSCIIDTRALVTAVDYTSVIVNDSCFITGFNILVYYNSSKGYGIKNIGNGVCLITLNKITSGGLGTFISTGPTIYKNVYDNVTIGIWLFTSNSIVRKNIIYIDPNAISSDAYGILIEATSNGPNPVIDSNYIEVNRGEGIYKSFGTNPTISNNTIILKHIGTRGIRLSSSDSAKVYNNSIYAEE